MTEDKMAHYHKVSYPKRIAVGYLIIICLGTVLLAMPFASKNGESIGILSALFTATSASCVTGLVVADTFSQWTLFGQIVILALIQVGGLGFMTVAVMFSFFMHRKIGLGMRDMLRESVNTYSIGGIVRLFQRILKGTLLFEGAGALILFVRFLPHMSVGSAAFYGVFHSISAFCNAGFDLMGRFAQYSSFTLFINDPIICLTLCALIVIGGIGFFVWDDICRHKLHFKNYMLHSKIALSMTGILLLGGTVFFMLFEYNNTLADMGFMQKLCASFYQSVTPRTAGFNFVDMGALTPAAKLMTVFLMFVGGSAGSTAGGVKVTTLAVIIAAAASSMHNRKYNNIFGRRLEDDAIRRASFVVTINFSLAFIAAVAITAVMPGLAPLDVIFEVASAIGTVGLTAGITTALNTFSRLLIILLMYCGRVGSMSFALLFVDTRTQSSVIMPEEKINIG